MVKLIWCTFDAQCEMIESGFKGTHYDTCEGNKGAIKRCPSAHPENAADAKSESGRAPVKSILHSTFIYSTTWWQDSKSLTISRMYQAWLWNKSPHHSTVPSCDGIAHREDGGTDLAVNCKM